MKWMYLKFTLYNNTIIHSNVCCICFVQCSTKSRVDVTRGYTVDTPVCLRVCIASCTFQLIIEFVIVFTQTFVWSHFFFSFWIVIPIFLWYRNALDVNGVRQSMEWNPTLELYIYIIYTRTGRHVLSLQRLNVTLRPQLQSKKYVTFQKKNFKNISL